MGQPVTFSTTAVSTKMYFLPSTHLTYTWKGEPVTKEEYVRRAAEAGYGHPTEATLADLIVNA